MQVKPILDVDFVRLVELYCEMGKELSLALPAVDSTSILISQVKTKSNFRALGLYEEQELIGFVTSYDLSESLVYFSGIYTKKRGKASKLLIEETHKFFSALGYTEWEADLNNWRIISILEKYNTIPISTKVRGTTHGKR